MYKTILQNNLYWSAERLFYGLDVVAFVGVIVAILVFAVVLKDILVVLLSGYADEHFAIGFSTVLQIRLIRIIACRLLAFRVLHQFVGRYVALALCYVDVETVGREPEQQLATL